MSATIERLLNTFERLPDGEKRELAREILRRTRDFDVPTLSDDELVLSAEEVFLELDKREQSSKQ